MEQHGQHNFHTHLTHDHKNQGNIKVAFFLNLSFTIAEIIGGLWTNSVAILSDAVHDLGDSLSLGLAWYFDAFSKKGPDEKYSFGYARFSLLAALINSLVLVGGSVLVLTRSVPRIFNPEPIDAKGMFVFAILGILINGLAVLKLKKGTSLNEKVVSWHLMEDVLGWVVILVASIVLMFVDIPILDPILSVLITIYVLFHVLKNLKEILNVFLQGVPKNFSISEIEQAIASIAGINSAHHTHIWSLEGEKNMLSTHILVNEEIGNGDLVRLKQEVRDLLSEKGIGHVTIETEFCDEECKGKNCS